MPSLLTENEIFEQAKRAEELVTAGEFQQAILAYQEIQPESAAILHRIGVLYSERLGDYDLAMSCFERALEIQDEATEMKSDILISIALTHQNCRAFDLALVYHQRALHIRQTTCPIDQKSVATSLLGIANAYWSLQNLSEALHYAQQALTLNQSIPTDNQPNIAASLAILANIYHSTGDDISALELAQRALALLETCVSSDSSSLAPLLNNIGAIQISMNLFNDALLTFIRALHICERTLPEGHPKRTTVENNVRLVRTMQENYYVESYSHLWQILTKFLLF